MQNTAWMALWRRLPPDQHDNLVVSTVAGTEILIQNVLRIETDFVVVRGRLAGSSETGRVYFIPYSQIDCAGFQKSLREEEFIALFPEVEPVIEAPEAAPPPTGPTTPLPPSKTLANSPTHGGTHGERARNGNRAPLPLKSELLERLRSRSHQGSTPRPPLEE
ncbi:MAG TPA: hypothetical protein VGG61_04150 [Gemmataceae bacterium]